MGPIKEILAETQFQEELTSSSQTKLVIVDFTASWCGPCQTIAPFYEQLSRKYPNAVFLKVDVDKCQETAVNQRVSVMPTFHFYRNKVKVDAMQGADRQKLEEMIQKYYEDGTAEDVGVAGHKKTDSPPKKAGKNKDKKEKGKDKEMESSQEPDLAAAKAESIHRIGNEHRSSFKERAKKMFGGGGNSQEEPPEYDGKKRRSFKDVMDNIFHPNHNRRETDPQATNNVKTEEQEDKKEKRKDDKL